jgi:signal transduction histidine kinase
VSTVSLAVPVLGDSAEVAVAELASWLLLVGVQVHRYRRADWTARQQTKLVLLAVVLVIANLVLGTLADLAGLIGRYQPIAVLLSYAALGALNVGLLVALFRFRLYDADIARPGADLAATIAQGLGLPYAAVYDHDDELVCAHGERPATPHRESVVDSDGATVGSLVLGPPRGSHRLDRHHRRVLAEVLPFVVIVLRARAEAQALKAARAAAAGAREDERRRLRRDLHDGVGPLLATQLLPLDTHRVTGRPELLVHLEEQARAAVGEVRRVAHDLRPAVLDAGGLPAALAAEAERVQVAGLPVELVVALGDAEPSAAAEVALLRIAQEALTNVVKHAEATAARVRLTADAHALELIVEDDGRGRAGAVDGIGTASMRERAVEIGGDVHIGACGPGTRVRVRVPR